MNSHHLSHLDLHHHRALHLYQKMIRQDHFEAVNIKSWGLKYMLYKLCILNGKFVNGFFKGFGLGKKL